jgi:ornithine cyclodeaminase/alanine dehydrogenase-like protein (mu-crystallin family)
VFLSGSDQVLGDNPPRKPFPTLLASGKFKPEDVAAEFCDVVTGKKAGRRAADEIILYESPGMGILDSGIGHWIYARAVKKNLGLEMPFGEEV